MLKKFFKVRCGKTDIKQPRTQNNNFIMFNELFKLSNEIKKSNITFHYDIPTAVVVGSQSSGKSMFINKLIKRNILTIGNGKMITKQPVQITLINCENDNICISYNENQKEIICLNDCFSSISDEHINNVLEKITEKNADVSENVIYVKIESRDVMNLCIIDNIGLISYSKSNNELVEKIENINKKMIDRDNCFIINVLKANNDIETDISYSFVKKHTRDRKNVKKIVVLTKIDTIDFDIDSFLNTNEKIYGVSNIYDDKLFYYQDHFSKSLMYKKKLLGIFYISNDIEKELNDFILQEMPNIKKNLIELKQKLSGSMQKNIFNEKQKVVYCASLINTICNLLNQSIESCGNLDNIGMYLNNYTQIMNKDILNYCPIDEIDDNSLFTIIKSYEGFELNNKINLVINHCICDKKKKPVEKIYNIFFKCCDDMNQKIIDFIEMLLNSSIDTYPVSSNKYDIRQYKNLKLFLFSCITDCLEKYKLSSLKIIEEQLKIQEQMSNFDIDYDIVYYFKKKENAPSHDLNLAEMSKDCLTNDIIMHSNTTSYNITQYRKTITKFFGSIKSFTLDIANKTILSSYINRIKYCLNGDLLEAVKNKDIDYLFYNQDCNENDSKNFKNVVALIDSFTTKFSFDTKQKLYELE